MPLPFGEVISIIKDLERRKNSMRERKKPSQSWVQRSKYEIENADRLLAERQEQLKEIRKKKTMEEQL